MKKLKISTRITLAYFILSAILLTVLIPSIYFMVEASLSDGLSGKLQLSASAVTEAMYEANGEILVDTNSIKRDDIRQGTYVRVEDEKGDVVYQSKHADETFLMANYQNGSIEDLDEWQFYHQSVKVGKQKVEVYALGSIFFNDFLADFIWILLGLALGYLLFTVIGAKLLTRQALKPIYQITETAKQISEGDLSKRIEGVTSKDEVGELANMFNRMISAVELSFQRERQFTSDASHELRTPMAVINACTEDALCTKDDEIRLENVKMIQKENERMTRMISQLLMLSRGYEGRYHFEPEELNLFDVAYSVTESMSVMAASRDIQIHNEIPDEMFIEADQSLLTQLLVNLVENAIKYGRVGGNIWISSETNAEGWELRIRDDGVGISEEDCSKIFERFYRADKARNRSGSGLGLSIAKWIVELHGWQISVESQLGEGTSMIIASH